MNSYKQYMYAGLMNHENWRDNDAHTQQTWGIITGLKRWREWAAHGIYIYILFLGIRTLCESVTRGNGGAGAAHG